MQYSHLILVASKLLTECVLGVCQQRTDTCQLDTESPIHVIMFN